MKCIATLPLDTDSPFWVPKDVFERHFDQADFNFRDEGQIESNYSRHWFSEPEGENNRFILPTVQIVSGATQFINGRHRAAVLFALIERVPMAFAVGLAEEFAKKLKLNPLSNNEQFELPDLPIVDRPEY